MITIDFPYSNNANIYWMGIIKKFHNHDTGTHLLIEAEKYAIAKCVESITVETLSPKERDNNCLKIYNFYLNKGFKLLFELKTYGPDHLMVYMFKVLKT